MLHFLGIGFTWVTSILAGPVLGLLYVMYAPVALVLWALGKCCKRCLCPGCLWQWVCATKVGSNVVVKMLRWLVFVVWRLVLSLVGLVLWVVIATGVWAVCVFISSVWLKVLIYGVALGCVAVLVAKVVPGRLPVLSLLKRVPFYATTLVAGLMGWLVLWLVLLNSVFTNVGPLVRCVAVPAAKMVNCDVTLERLDLCPFEGRLTIAGLRVEQPRAFVEAKPEVYKATPFVVLEEWTVHVDVASFFKDGAFSMDEVRVKNFTLKGLHVAMAWDRLIHNDETFVVTNVDALLMQMGIKPYPTPASVEVEKQAAITKQAEKQAAATSAPVEASAPVTTPVVEATPVAAPAPTATAAPATPVATAKSAAPATSVATAKSAAPATQPKTLQSSVDEVKAKVKVNAIMEKLYIGNNGVTLFCDVADLYDLSFVPEALLKQVPTKVSFTIPTLEAKDISTEELRAKVEPVMDAMVETYDFFNALRLGLFTSMQEFFDGLLALGQNVFGENVLEVGKRLLEETQSMKELKVAGEKLSETSNLVQETAKQLFSTEATTEEKSAAVDALIENAESLIKDGKALKKTLKSSSKDDLKSLGDGLKSLNGLF